jgi:hypothetical protein
MRFGWLITVLCAGCSLYHAEENPIDAGALRPDSEGGNDAYVSPDSEVLPDAAVDAGPDATEPSPDARVGPDATPPPYTVLASGLDLPFAIVSRGDHIYFTTFGEGDLAGTVSRVPAEGGAVQVLASGLDAPSGLAVDDTAVYFTEQGTRSPSQGRVARVPLAGGAVTVLSEDEVRPYGIVLDEDVVFWTDAGHSAGTGAVRRQEKAGGSVVTLRGGLDEPLQLVSDGDPAGSLHVLSTGLLLRVSKQPGQPSAIVMSGLYYPYGLTRDADAVYYTDAALGVNARLIRRRPLSSTSDSLAGYRNVTALAIDDGWIYAVDYAQIGGLIRVPLGGGEAEIVESTLAAPYGIAVDPRGVLVSEFVLAGRLLLFPR